MNETQRKIAGHTFDPPCRKIRDGERHLSNFVVDGRSVSLNTVSGEKDAVGIFERKAIQKRLRPHYVSLMFMHRMNCSCASKGLRLRGLARN
jgi:hypothetical protein